MWKLRITYDPLPRLHFELPGTLDGDDAIRHVLEFRFINPRIPANLKEGALDKTAASAYEQSKSLETASRQECFPYIGIRVKELFRFNFNAFGGRLSGNLDILQDIVSDAGKSYALMYPEGRETGKKYRGSEPNRIFPLYLLHEYIKRLPHTMLTESRICATDMFETTIDILRSREGVDSEEGIAYLFNRLTMENSRRSYYKFLEKRYDAVAMIASVLDRTTATLEQQKRDILRLQTQVASLSAPNASLKDACDQMMSLK